MLRSLHRAAAVCVLAGVCAATATGQAVRPRPDLITAETEGAIRRAQAFLARVQARDGSWRGGRNSMAYPCAMTSLAGLALMAGGNTPSEGDYADEVRAGLDYVLTSAGRNGLIARTGEEQRPMYSHGFGMLFLAQAYGAEHDAALQHRIHDVLRRAVVLTARSQSAAGGWLYTPDANGDEGSVTITQIQALRAARNAGIKVPKSTIDRAVLYIARCANEDGGISYSLRNLGSSRPAITAAAVATLYSAGQYDHPVAPRALDYLKERMAADIPNRGHETYMLLYGGMSMYLSGEENWRAYFPKVRDDLLKSQNEDGSWPGDMVGEVYGTSAALLVLQLPYRYLPILQR